MTEKQKELLKRPGEYIYTYSYKSDENWLNRTEIPEDPTEYTVEEQEAVAERARKFMQNPGVRCEIAKTADTVMELCKNAGSKLVFYLLADTHYVLNGNWEETEATVKAVDEALKQRGVSVTGTIHLGDFTDGILSKEMAKRYSGRVIEPLKALGYPLYIAIGNHDANYFKKNKEAMSAAEQALMYLGQEDPWYRVDLEEAPLTLLVLHSFDKNQKLRYGFSDEEVGWVRAQLDELAAGDRRILVVSHDAPQQLLDFWAKDIRNGDMLCSLLDEWNETHDKRIIGFLHGHTHADLIHEGHTFPIVSTGSTKLEYFSDKRPDGSLRQVRQEGEVTQELWDILVLDTDTWDMDFVRFGAGQDRHVSQKKHLDIPEIWTTYEDYMPYCMADRMTDCGDTCGTDRISIDRVGGIIFRVEHSHDRKHIVLSQGHIPAFDGQEESYTTLEQALEDASVMEDAGNPPKYISDVQDQKQKKRVIVELNNSGSLYPGLERDLVEFFEKYDLDPIYISRNHESLMRIRRMDESAVCGLMYEDGIYDAPAYAKRLEMDMLVPAMKNVRYPGFMEDCGREGIGVAAWPVKNADELEMMRQRGVMAVITDRPDLAARVYYGDKMPEVKAEEDIKGTDGATFDRTEPVPEIKINQKNSPKWLNWFKKHI